jgi:hypothetical protein
LQHQYPPEIRPEHCLAGGKAQCGVSVGRAGNFAPIVPPTKRLNDNSFNEARGLIDPPSTRSPQGV